MGTNIIHLQECIEGKKVRVRFCGPRHDYMRLYCLKRNAKAFSVYFD